MTHEFFGTDAATHDAFQAWRRANPDCFHMTETATGNFAIHYTQDRRENSTERGCMHQGISDNEFRADKGGCYTTARKICAETLAELLSWIQENGFTASSCKHCDTARFPFPVADAGNIGIPDHPSTSAVQCAAEQLLIAGVSSRIDVPLEKTTLQISGSKVESTDST